MDCVCGCSATAHLLSYISVPLPPRPGGPLYETNGAMNKIGATYDLLVCRCCNCREYLADEIETAS